MRRLLSLTLLVLLTGCIMLPRRVKDLPDSRATLDRKKVVDKREPNWLVAFDGSVCSVSKDKYDRTVPGDVVWCAWRGSRFPSFGQFARH